MKTRSLDLDGTALEPSASAYAFDLEHAMPHQPLSQWQKPLLHFPWPEQLGANQQASGSSASHDEPANPLRQMQRVPHCALMHAPLFEQFSLQSSAGAASSWWLIFIVHSL